DPNSNLGRIKAGGELNTLIPSISGQVSDEHAAGGQALFGICMDTETECYIASPCNQRDITKWLEYPATINNSGQFTISGIPSQNGQSYTWELVLRDKAGNESAECAHAGSYTIQIPEEPYYFKNYSTTPRSPILEQAEE
ncbi:hypothetical protein V6O07_08540, partial [Arthrospira platensis SPKY2]